MLRKGAGKLRTYNVLESLYLRTVQKNELNESQDPFKTYENMLRDFATAVRHNNSRLILLAAQVRDEDKRNNYGQGMLKLNAIAEKVAHQENIPFVDTDPYFAHQGSGWYDNVHFDERGHRLTAEALSLLLSKELGLENNAGESR